MKVNQTLYGGGKDGAEVVLIEIEGGGHTWPGKKSPIGLIGKSTLDVSANDLMWEFFRRHPIRKRIRFGITKPLQ
jgi:polyhydroxybutyrate depolymerase